MLEILPNYAKIMLLISNIMLTKWRRFCTRNQNSMVLSWFRVGNQSTRLVQKVTAHAEFAKRGLESKLVRTMLLISELTYPLHTTYIRSQKHDHLCVHIAYFKIWWIVDTRYRWTLGCLLTFHALSLSLYLFERFSSSVISWEASGHLRYICGWVWSCGREGWGGLAG